MFTDFKLRILPFPKRRDDGSIDLSRWTAPQFVYDMVRAALLPERIAKGGDWTPEDAADAALSYGILGAPVAGAGKALGGKGQIRNGKNCITA